MTLALQAWPAPADRLLVDVLRALPDVAPTALEARRSDLASLFARAELHGVAGVVHDAFCAAGGTLEEPLTRSLEARRLARELDHGAHLAVLRKVDAALHASRLRAVVLKGPLFAERFYARPSARATSDIDLLVEEATLDAAAAALSAAGYERSLDPSEARFRREHHHLHLEHRHALPLELHFHAYRGFGHVIYSEPLIARSTAAHDPSLEALAVLAPEDEVVYLAVHAAAHRFVRLGWLYDLKLLVAAMSDRSLQIARERASKWGYARVLAFAAELLDEVMGVPRARPLGRLGAVRSPLVHGVAPEPTSAVLRSATRLVYTTTLCDTPSAAARYAAGALAGRARLLLGGSP